MSFISTLFFITHILCFKRILREHIVPSFLAHKVGRLTCVSISSGFCLDRIVISEALFTLYFQSRFYAGVDSFDDFE